MKSKTDSKNIIGLTITSFGQYIFISLTSMALPMFFTDVLYIAPTTVSLIFLVVRIWDAVNDPIMGAIVDRTHTRWGKCKPYILFGTIPLFFFTILLFMPINSKGNNLTMYYFIMYVLFITAHTMLDISLAGIKPLLFTDPDKRNKGMSISATFGSLGTLLAIDLFFIFVQLTGGGDNKKGYFITVLLLSILALITVLIGFLNMKEVIPVVRHKTSFFKSLKVVAKNKYLLIIIASSFVGIGISGYGVLLPYFAKWNLADSFSFGRFSVEAVMIPILSTITGVIYMVAVFITPFLLKYISKRKLFFTMCISGIILNALSYVAGYKDLYLFMAIRFVAHVPPSVTFALCGFMLADTLDYAEYTNNQRTEGISYAFNNLLVKSGNAIFSALVLFMLGVYGYNAAIMEPALGMGESMAHNYPNVLDGIFYMMTVFPAVSLLLQAIPLLFYDLSDKRHLEIVAMLQAKRESIV